MAMKKVMLTLGAAAFGTQAIAAIDPDSTSGDFVVGLTLLSECVFDPTTATATDTSSEILDFGEFNVGDAAPVGFTDQVTNTAANDSHVGTTEATAGGGTGFVVRCNAPGGWEIALDAGVNQADADSANPAVAGVVATDRKMVNTNTSADWVAYTLHCGTGGAPAIEAAPVTYPTTLATQVATNATRCGTAATADWGSTSATDTWTTGATGGALVAVPIEGRLRATNLDYEGGDYIDTVTVTLTAL